MKLTLTAAQLYNILRTTGYYPHAEVHRGRLIISKDCYLDTDHTNLCISAGAMFDLTADVEIGPWCMIGAGTQLWTHDHFHEGRDKPLLQIQEEKGVKYMPKKIGKDVWIHGAIILMQATEIPDGVVIGAGSVLTTNPRPYEIWAGSPARCIGERQNA